MEGKEKEDNEISEVKFFDSDLDSFSKILGEHTVVVEVKCHTRQNLDVDLMNMKLIRILRRRMN